MVDYSLEYPFDGRDYSYMFIMEVSMLRRQGVWVAVVLSAALVLVSSCSRAPSGSTIQSAITELLKREVPMEWSGSMMGGQNARIELIEIKQIGKFNDKDKYWPVKARVKGTCQANFILSMETRAFDRVGDFMIYQDDYGNWKASLK